MRVMCKLLLIGYRAIINFYYCRLRRNTFERTTAIEPLLISTIVDAMSRKRLEARL